MAESPDGDEPAPWRKADAKPDPAAGGPKAAPGVKWQDSGPKPGKGSQIAVTVLIFFALLGAVVAAVLWLRTPTPVGLVAIPVSEYDHVTWASNPTADRDADRLIAKFDRGERTSADQERRRLRTLLAELAGRPADHPLVVYVSALAVVRDGQVFLLPGEARIDHPDEWVPVAEVLERVAACPAQKKALLLDVARPAADPFRGPLSDDVAARLDAALAAAPPDFPVLCSCSPGEQSLTIPELGAAAFVVYAEEALTGAADGYPPATETDGKVSFAELAEFVTRRVAQWADKVANARQVPKRYGPAGADFVLTYRYAPPPAAEPVVTAASPYPAELLAGWKVRDAARAGRGLALAPEVVGELDALLLRAEDRYLAGVDGFTPRFEVGRRDADRRLDERTRIPPPAPPATLHDLRAGSPEPSPQLAAALERWRRLRWAKAPVPAPAVPPPAAKPEELEAAELEVEKLARGKTADAAWLIWSLLAADTELTQEKVAAAVEAINAAPLRPAPPATEVYLLRQLAAAPPPKGAYPEAVMLLLRAEAAFGETIAATAGHPPGGFVRVRAALDDAVKRKHDGERALFAGRADAAVVALRDAARQFTQIRDRAEGVRTARRVWGESAARLHAALPAMVAATRPDAAVEADWLTTARLAADIAKQLGAGPTEPFDSDVLAAKTEQLKRAAEKLAVPVTPNQLRALEQAADQRAQQDALSELRRLLAGSGPPAEGRAGVATAARKLSAQMYDRVRNELDAKQSPGGQITPIPARGPVSATDALVRTQRRADASVALLRLAGYDGMGQIDPLREAAGKDRTDPAKWQVLGDRLSKAWTADLRSAAAGHAAAGRWGPVERILRAAPAGIDGFDQVRGFGELFWEEERARRGWLVAEFRACQELRKDFTPAAEFFDGLAGQYARPLPKGGR